MEMIIRPFEGVGSIRFGMSSREVRAFFKSNPESFQGFPDYEMQSDSFDEHGIHVHYRKIEGCHDVEIFEGLGDADPVFEGKHLFQTPYVELKKWFGELDLELRIDETGFTSPRFGISVCRSEEDEDVDLSEVRANYVAVFDQLTQVYSRLFFSIKAD